ncbi:MAG: VWA domain-containing protein [Rhodospirillales bacterium]|nr:VWA domain-containing protein [Rhodospirillales bacterium]
MPRLNVFRYLISAFFISIFAVTGASAAAVRTEVEVDRPVVLAGEDIPVYVLVRFEVPEQSAAVDKERPPLNIALVLDRSGSMEAAGKLPYLKAAAKTMLGRMTPRDRLAIIEYDDRVTVAWPSAPVESPALIAKVIDALEPRGNTDLVGGMLAGVAQVHGNFKEASINRVLLLSDGLANEGVTNPAEIRKLVRQAKKKGVPVTTLGLGLEYDEDLMQDIAEYSGGAYYYIENPKQSVSVFQREISTLFKTAARDVDIRFTPGELVKGVQVFGYASRTDGGATVVEFSDFHSGEQRTLVMRLELKGGGAGPASLGVLDFSYDDVAGGTRAEQTEELVVEVTRDADAVRHATNRETVVVAALAEADAEHEASLRLLDAGNWKEAEEKLEKLASHLTARNADIGDIRLAKKIEALTIENSSVISAGAAPAAASSMMYMKRSKQRLYQAGKGQRGLSMLQSGDSGSAVERLQRAMKDAGQYSGPVDGDYSDDLEDAVRSYQSDNNLTSDGVAGPATLDALGLY